MITPQENLLSPKTVCGMFPGRTGNGVSISTVWRWLLYGCKCPKTGEVFKLESMIVGGQRYTSAEAINRWLAKLNSSEDMDAQPLVPVSTTRTAARAATVDQELDAAGF